MLKVYYSVYASGCVWVIKKERSRDSDSCVINPPLSEGVAYKCRCRDVDAEGKHQTGVKF